MYGKYGLEPDFYREKLFHGKIKDFRIHVYEHDGLFATSVFHPELILKVIPLFPFT